MTRLLLFVDAILIVFAGWLGVQLYRVWNPAPAAISAPGPVSGAPAPAVSAPPSAKAPAGPPLPLSALAVVAERNLFNPNRTETPPEPPKPATATPFTPPTPPPPKPRLYGIVLGSGEGGRAYLEDPRTRKVFGYTIGDSVAESRLERIESDRVVLRRGGEVYEVLLRDPSKPRPAPAPPAPLAPGPRQPGVPQPPPGAPTPQVAPFPGGQPSTESPPAATAPGVPGAPQPGIVPRRPPVRVPGPAPGSTSPPIPQGPTQGTPSNDDED